MEEAMVTNALAVLHEREMTPMEAHAAYIEEKRDIIKRMCMPPKHLANDALFENFIEISKLTGLNPIRKQLYCIDYGQGPNIVTGIDGLRLIASRTSAYGGGDEYTYEDGEITQSGVALPARATCTVYRIVNGMRCPFTCTVRWDEFGKKPFVANYANNWKTMPYHMLGKVAESHALRRAFPEETSGLYTTDEMAQAESVPSSAPRTIGPASTPIEQPRSAPLSAARTKATPNGREQAAAKLIADAEAKGVTLDADDTPGMWADDIDAALDAAGSTHRVPRDEQGTPLAGALSKALLALPRREIDAETGEVRDEDAGE
jgi:phage recombination protein Bet